MQKFANGQLLGALIFTLPAGNAFLHRAFDFLILLFRRVGVCHAFVVLRENFRDFHAGGTGHAIFAMGAVNPRGMLKHGFRLYVAGFLFFCKLAGAAFARVADIVLDLLRAAHAAEQKTYFRAIPNEVKRRLHRRNARGERCADIVGG